MLDLEELSAMLASQSGDLPCAKYVCGVRVSVRGASSDGPRIQYQEFRRVQLWVQVQVQVQVLAAAQFTRPACNPGLAHALPRCGRVPSALRGRSRAPAAPPSPRYY